MFSKKINILFCAIALVAFSCTPLEDTFNELDSKIDKNAISDIKSQVEKVMSADDYAEISKLFAKSKDSTTAKNIAKYKNFGSDDLAKKFIPSLLKKQYGHLGNGSAVKVTYKLYDPIKFKPKKVTLKKADYDLIGGDVQKKQEIVSVPNDLYTLADKKYSNPKNGDAYLFTYQKGGKAESLTVFRLKGSWTKPNWVVAKDEYTAMGQRFPNFSSRTTAKRNIAIYANTKFSFAKDGDKKFVEYTYTFKVDKKDAKGNVVKDNKGKVVQVRVFEPRYAYIVSDGTKWNVLEDAVDKKLQFGLEKNVWVPDNTIKFIFSATDFTFISKQTDLHIKGALESVGKYKNFDRRLGKDNYWSDEKILKAVNELLKSKYKSAKEGQKFEVSYAIFNGAAGTETIKVILKGKDYILQK